MADRTEVELKFGVTGRQATVKAYDTVGVEDAYGVLIRAEVHRRVTREDLTEPTPREIKDWILKQGLVI